MERIPQSNEIQQRAWRYVVDVLMPEKPSEANDLHTFDIDSVIRSPTPRFYFIHSWLDKFERTKLECYSVLLGISGLSFIALGICILIIINTTYDPHLTNKHARNGLCTGHISKDFDIIITITYIINFDDLIIFDFVFTKNLFCFSTIWTLKKTEGRKCCFFRRQIRTYNKLPKIPSLYCLWSADWSSLVYHFCQFDRLMTWWLNKEKAYRNRIKSRIKKWVAITKVDNNIM